VLEKYEERVQHFRHSTKRAQMQINNLNHSVLNNSLGQNNGPTSMTIVENSIFAGLESDATEISKIRQDLVALRCEIEASE
jgi:hypothetical protein